MRAFAEIQAGSATMRLLVLDVYTVAIVMRQSAWF